MVDNQNFSELAALASQLNSQSDNLNRSIEILNAKLAALNLGLEVWLEDSPLKDSDEYPLLNSRYREFTTLGYAKVDGDWQLAVREKTLLLCEDNIVFEDPQIDSLTHIPLLKATREIRLKAAGEFDNLFDALRYEAKKMLENVAAALKTATLG